MDPIVATLIWTVIVVLVAPVIVACVFLGGGRSVPQIPNLLALLLRKLPPLTADECAIRNIEGRYQDLQSELIQVRQRVAAARAAERNLRKQIASLSDEFTDLELIPEKNSAQIGKEKAIQQRLIELNSRLSEQEKETKDFREKLTELEASVQASYTYKQISIAKLKCESALKAADKIISKMNASKHNNVILHWEKKVVEREAEATRLFELRKSGELEIKPPSFGMRVLFNVHRCTSFVAIKVDKFNARVADLCAAIDPSIARAFERLQLHAKHARICADMSKSAESDLELTVRAETNRWANMINCTQSEIESVHARGRAEALLPGQEESVQNLTAVLEIIKTKNLSIQQTLFYVDAIVTRLSILRLLIPAIPTAKNSMQSQFIDLSNSFSAYLQTCTEKEIPSVPNDLVVRLHNLEQNTLMMYIKIAKGDSKDLSAKSFERLKNDVATISAALDLEKTEAAFELEKWTGISTQAERENQSLLHVVAQNRTARCSEIIKLTEQTIEVLNVTVSMAESRAQKSKAS